MDSGLVVMVIITTANNNQQGAEQQSNRMVDVWAVMKSGSNVIHRPTVCPLAWPLNLWNVVGVKNFTTKSQVPSKSFGISHILRHKAG